MHDASTAGGYDCLELIEDRDAGPKQIILRFTKLDT
jgi:hypothetical protein